MAVFIDIPGIGTVEAKNAASEATLAEMLKTMKSIGKAGSSGGNNTGSSSSNKGSSTAGGPTIFKNIALSATQLAGKFNRVAGDLAAMGNSATDAAKMFSGIPILGTVFSTVASSANKMSYALISASSGGASFGGSISSFSKSASEAGMNLQEFGSLIAANGAGMLGFGATTEDGAKNFARVSKNLRETSGELYALGMSTQEINEGLVNYGKNLRLQGLQGNKSNTDLAKGAKDYLKEMDSLAKITGEDRKAKEAERDALLKDAQFQASMMGVNEQVRASFLGTVQALPKGMQNFTKDILAAGTATTEENQALMAQMPESAAMLTQFHAKMQRGEAVTDAERNRLNNLMAKEGPKALQNMKYAAAAGGVAAGTVNSLASTLEIQQDAVKKGLAGTANASKTTDGFNEKMQKMGQTLSVISNTFTQFLASSGFLDIMMVGVQLVATVISEILMPALASLGAFVKENLLPVFNTIGTFIKDQIYPAFLFLASVVQVDIIPVLQTLSEIVSQYVFPALESIGSMISTYVLPAFETIATFIVNNVTPILLGVGTALAAYGLYLAATTVVGWLATGGLTALASATLAAALPFLAIAIPIVALIAGFKALYDSGWTLGSAFEAIKDNLKGFFLTLKEGFLTLLDKITFGDANKAIKQAQKEAEAEREILKAKEEIRDDTRKAVADERKNDNKKEQRAEAAKKLDEKIQQHAGKFGNAIGKTAEKAEKDAKIVDTNAGPEALLLQFKNQQASAGVDSAKGALVADAESKKAAEVKAKEDAKAQEAAKPAGAAPTQESAETLLAQLNTNMTRLIQITQEQKSISEDQLRGIKGMSGNLFA